MFAALEIAIISVSRQYCFSVMR